MYKTGLLLLTQPLHIAETQAGYVLSHILRKVKDTLYVHLLPSVTADQLTTSKIEQGQIVIPCYTSTFKLIANYYSETNRQSTSNYTQQQPDLRVLLGNISNKKSQIGPQALNSPCNIIFLDAHCNESDKDCFKKYVQRNLLSNENIKEISVETVPESNEKILNSLDQCLHQTYDSVCVGGTFDG